MAERKRYLILAEGKSGDPHYGKTARGVMRYVPEQVVVLLDRARAGETEQGFPIVGTVEEALAYEPTTGMPSSVSPARVESRIATVGCCE